MRRTSETFQRFNARCRSIRHRNGVVVNCVNLRARRRTGRIMPRPAARKTHIPGCSHGNAALGFGGRPWWRPAISPPLAGRRRTGWPAPDTPPPIRWPHHIERWSRSARVPPAILSPVQGGPARSDSDTVSAGAASPSGASAVSRHPAWLRWIARLLLPMRGGRVHGTPVSYHARRAAQERALARRARCAVARARHLALAELHSAHDRLGTGVPGTAPSGPRMMEAALRGAMMPSTRRSKTRDVAARR